MSEAIELKHEPSKYDKLIAAAQAEATPITIVAHPCDETSLRGALEAAKAELIKPVLVGPEAKIRAVASDHRLEVGAWEIVDAPHSHAAAAKAVALVPRRQGRASDEGQLAHRRADEGGHCLRHRSSDRPADQSCLHHGCAGPCRYALHHGRCDQHFPRSRGQARHRPERDRPLVTSD